MLTVMTTMTLEMKSHDLHPSLLPFTPHMAHLLRPEGSSSDLTTQQ